MRRALLMLMAMMAALVLGSAVALTATILGVGESVSYAHEDPHDPFHHEEGEKFWQSCAARLPNLPIDHTFSDQVGGREETVPATPEPGNENRCYRYLWAAGNTGNGLAVIPRWAGPEITSSAWDCSHSSIEYAVFRERRTFSFRGFKFKREWFLAGGGRLWGRFNKNVCTYSVDGGIPRGWGTNGVGRHDPDSPPFSWISSEFRVATSSWSHNDRKLSHPGTLCDDPVSCYWPTRLLIGTSERGV